MKQIDGWFQWYFRYWLDIRSQDDEIQINRWKGIVSRFRGKLVKMIKDAGSKFDDYSISPKTRQFLLHLVYELTEKDFFIDSVQTISYITSKFKFVKKKKCFVGSLLNNNLHNQCNGFRNQ